MAKGYTQPSLRRSNATAPGPRKKLNDPDYWAGSEFGGQIAGGGESFLPPSALIEGGFDPVVARTAPVTGTEARLAAQYKDQWRAEDFARRQTPGALARTPAPKAGKLGVLEQFEASQFAGKPGGFEAFQRGEAVKAAGAEGLVRPTGAAVTRGIRQQTGPVFKGPRFQPDGTINPEYREAFMKRWGKPPEEVVPYIARQQSQALRRKEVASEQQARAGQEKTQREHELALKRIEANGKKKPAAGPKGQPQFDINSALKALIESGATPDEVMASIQQYQTAFGPQATPQAPGVVQDTGFGPPQPAGPGQTVQQNLPGWLQFQRTDTTVPAQAPAPGAAAPMMTAPAQPVAPQPAAALPTAPPLPGAVSQVALSDGRIGFRMQDGSVRDQQGNEIFARSGQPPVLTR